MATPVASGLCGLILSVNPDLTPDELESILESSCEDIDTVPGNENYVNLLGAGRINAYEAFPQPHLHRSLIFPPLLLT